MITFLIAGHETTSGMLSFVFYYLLRHPEAYRKAQKEVDHVVGRESVQPEHLNKLPYITAVLRETARLQSTVPAFAFETRSEQGELLGGKYFIGPDEAVIAVLHNVHRDPAVYGEDAEDFNPEGMLDENFEKLPPNSWKPFGNGARGCIGRPFAWQEMMLVMAMLLQYYNFTLDDPQYNLQIAFTLTIKPKNLHMKATLREGWTARSIEQSLSGSVPGTQHVPTVQPANSKPVNVTMDTNVTGKPLTILYGSNSGTCEAFAQTLAADASAHGFTATKVDTLDSARQKLPTEEPVIIITASYEGQPCDNAALWYDWVQNLPSDLKLKTNFAVFCCGHSDWKQTFHKIPIAIDGKLEELGGERLCDIGLANAANAAMMSDFQTWEDQTLWPALTKKYGGNASESGGAQFSQNVSVEVFSKRASDLRSDVYEAKVITSKLLTASGLSEKRNIELQRPSTMTYKAGDYCAVLPLNPPELVHRVMTRFSLPWDAMLKIASRTGSQLPTEHPVSAHNLFAAYLELAKPATRRNIAMLIEASNEDGVKNELTKLSGDNFTNDISAKRVSLLDLLEKYPTIQLPLGAFVGSLISMRVRQYSISSSPLSDPTKPSLTYAVLDEPSLSGRGRHVGVASHYLSTLRPNHVIHVAVKPSHQAFHLPNDAENTPLVMIAAGTGLAPFRGFIQERAAQIGSGRKLAAAHLYFGCRHSSKDDIYREELDFWEKMGAVTVHRAYSQAPEESRGHKHIDEAVLADKELLLELWEQNARVYVCDSRGLGESAKSACIEIAREAARRRGKPDSDEALNKWFESVRNERYSTDVFA